MGLFKNLFEGRTERVKARQAQRTERARLRQERKAVESLTGQSSAEPWANAIGSFTSNLTGLASMYLGGDAASGVKSEKKSDIQAEQTNYLLYGGIALALVIIVFVIIKMKK